MSDEFGTEAYAVYRTVDYLQELGRLAMPHEPPRLDLVIEIFNTVDVIIADLTRIRPRMMAEQNGLVRLQAMQAEVVLETDGEASGALVEFMAGPANFILVCGRGGSITATDVAARPNAGAEHVFERHRRCRKAVVTHKLVRECRPDIARLHIADMRG